MTKSPSDIIYGGNFNFFGVQGDIGRWSDPSGYIIGAHEDKEGRTNCRRYFASFSSLDNAGNFMVYQVKQPFRKLMTSTTAEAITEAYILHWWSPDNKDVIVSARGKADPAGKYQEKLRITRQAIAALATYGISI
jgi:hypothetical protein